MDDLPKPEFATDQPLLKKSDDRLNRAAFAERVGGVLLNLPKGASLVIGIHGPWGDGKTTVLNLLRAELADEPTVALVNFNPWRFTSEHLMLAGFFGVLADEIRAKLKTKGEEIAGWLEKVGRVASVVDSRFGTISEVAGSKAEAGLEELRNRLSESLLDAGQKIVVLVDDIDRLDKHEIRTLFRIIKACADFPNVCYVLAFDDVVVAKSLGEQYGSGDEASGRAFLEKIIQVPLKLPVAMKEDLRSLCFEQVDRAIASAGIELSEKEVTAFVSGFDRGVSIRLDTPRAAKRFANGLMFSLPMLKGEVNIVDLLLLEAVRAFYPAVYDCIRTNHAEFAGVEPDYGGRNRDEVRAVELLKHIIDDMDSEQQKAVKPLLRGLFPRLGSAYGGGGYGSQWLDRWAKDKRVCSPDYCSRYFSYAVPRNDISESGFEDLCQTASTGDQRAIDLALAGLFTGGKARRVIERLRQREEDIQVEAAPTLARSIAKNARRIQNPLSLFGFDQPPAQAAMLVSSLIRLLPEGEERTNLAKRVMEIADPLWFATECLRWMYVTDDEDKAEHNTLTKPQVDEVRKQLVVQIKQRSGDGEPLFDVSVQQESSLLYEWWRAEGRDPVQAHLSAVFERDHKSIAIFLRAMAPRSWGMEDGVPKVGRLDADQLKNIKLLYDLHDLAALIQEYLPGKFDDPQWDSDGERTTEQKLAEQFIFVWRNWKTEGEQPDRAADETAKGGDQPNDELPEDSSD
jgi:KAP family P-loop domain